MRNGQDTQIFPISEFKSKALHANPERKDTLQDSGSCYLALWNAHVP